jgi:hypothetical protein
MAATATILTSLHGKLIGLSKAFKLVVGGRTALCYNDTGRAIGLQGSQGSLNATGALTAALLKTGIVNSTTAAAVVATLDTGTAMDTSFASPDNLLVNEAFEWSAINTGANTFTVTAAATHTVVGSGVVAAGTSARFLTRKTAANTYVTYRLA